MYYAYVLYSLKDHRLYKGVTSDIASRFNRHNSGGNKSTAKRKPFVLLVLRSFETKSLALQQERHWKTLAGGDALRAELCHAGLLDESGRVAD